MDSPNLDAITNLTTSQRAATPGFLSGQLGQTNDFLNRFKGAIGGQESVPGMAARIGGELGLPGLQSNATMLQNTMSNLPTTYSGAVRGFDVNNNQLQRIIAQKSSELAPAVTTAQNSLQSAQNTLNTQMGYTQAEQQKQLLPYQTEQSMLSDRLARETTLYTTQNQQELDALIAKTNAGITLSEGEKNRAQQLAVQEQTFENQKALNTQQASLSSSSGNADTSYHDVGGQLRLINNATGQVVANLGTTVAPQGMTVDQFIAQANASLKQPDNNGSGVSNQPTQAGQYVGQKMSNGIGDYYWDGQVWAPAVP